MSTIDRLATNNVLTNKSANMKLGYGIISLALIFIFDNLYFHIGIFVLNLLLVTCVAKINYKTYLKLFKGPMWFIILGVISVVIGFSHENVGFISSVKCGNIYVGIQRASVHDAKMIFQRSFAAISATYFMSVTTPITDFAKVLYKCKCPKEFIEQMILMYRFIEIFSIEVHELQVAAELKGGFTGFKNWLRSVSKITESLFLRVMGSYTDFKNALDLKLFDGNFYFEV